MRDPDSVKLSVTRTECRGVVILSAPWEVSSRYIWIARRAGGFTVGGSAPFASPVKAAKFARRILRDVLMSELG